MDTRFYGLLALFAIAGMHYTAMGCVAKTLLGQKNPVSGVRIMQLL